MIKIIEYSMFSFFINLLCICLYYDAVYAFNDTITHPNLTRRAIVYSDTTKAID